MRMSAVILNPSYKEGPATLALTLEDIGAPLNLAQVHQFRKWITQAQHALAHISNHRWEVPPELLPFDTGDARTDEKADEKPDEKAGENVEPRPGKMVEIKMPKPSPHDTDLAVMRMLVTLAAVNERDATVRGHLVRMARSRDYIEIGQMAENLRLHLDVMI